LPILQLTICGQRVEHAQTVAVSTASAHTLREQLSEQRAHEVVQSACDNGGGFDDDSRFLAALRMQGVRRRCVL
jgi:hypothetical protein